MSKRMMICPNAKTCKSVSCRHSNRHEHNSTCKVQGFICEGGPCIPYVPPRKRPAKRTRKVVLKGWTLDDGWGWLGATTTWKTGVLKSVKPLYRATLTIEVPVK